MRTILFIILFGILAPTQAMSNNTKVNEINEQWSKLLTKYLTTEGKIDYQGISKDSILDSLIQNFSELDTTKMSENTKKALYINFYNASMIYNILRYAKEEKIDVNSPSFINLRINDIKVSGGNIWNGNYKVKFNDSNVNLDDIEHKLIRGIDAGNLEKYKVKELDPRIHAAVNCAAISCPRVREVAYTESNINKLLDENMKQFLSTESQFSKIEESKLKANSIIFWYYSDFDDYGKKLKLPGAGDYLAQFIDLKANDSEWKIKHFKSEFNDRSKFSLKLSSQWDFHYNWQINDKRNK